MRYILATLLVSQLFLQKQLLAAEPVDFSKSIQSAERDAVENKTFAFVPDLERCFDDLKVFQ